MRRLKRIIISIYRNNLIASVSFVTFSYIIFFTSYGTYTIAHKEYNSRFINPMFYRKMLALFRRGCTWSRNERDLASFFVHVSPQRCISDVDCVRPLARSHDPFEHTLSIAGIVSFELFKRRPPKPSRFRFATTAAHARMRRDARRIRHCFASAFGWGRICSMESVEDSCAWLHTRCVRILFGISHIWCVCWRGNLTASFFVDLC